jgi:hypothetical protein
MMHQLCLEAMEETFSNGIIPTISFARISRYSATKDRSSIKPAPSSSLGIVKLNANFQSVVIYLKN